MKTDPVELEIFRHLFASIAEEMGIRLTRSAFSPNIKERRDHSCALFDSAGVMIAQAAHIPVHLGSTPMSVRAAIDSLGDQLGLGGVAVLNDPFQGGTHLPDITLVAPVFVPGESTPRFYVANRAHHADVGGASPGSMAVATHIDQEGLRLPPTLLTEPVVDQIAAASRTPDERRGDLRAQLAAIKLGETRLLELCDRYGTAVVSARARDLQDYAERLMAATLEGLPDGTYEFSDFLDDDGLDARDVRVCVRITVAGRQAVVDFAGCDPQVAGPVNAVRAITVSAVDYAFRCIAPGELPTNGGAMRPIEVLTHPGTVVDALPPAAVAAGNVETSQRIVDVVLGALGRASPVSAVGASCGSMNNITIGGHDPRHGRPFAYYETIGGGAGGCARGPGASGVHTHMTNTLNTPVEALEHAYPLRIVAYRLRDGSGGAGHHAGGDGLVRSYLFEEPAEVTLLTERRRRQPYGAEGGRPGATGENVRVRKDGAREPLPAKGTLHVDVGEVVEVCTPGGGGWGRAQGK